MKIEMKQPASRSPKVFCREFRLHKGEFELLDLLINAGTSQIYQEPLGAVHVGCDLLIPMLILQRGSPFFLELPALFLCQGEHDQGNPSRVNKST